MTPAEQVAALPKRGPSEGQTIHEQTIRNLRHRMEDALTTGERKAWIGALKHQAQTCVLDDGTSLSYHIGSPGQAVYAPTERRYGIVGGLIALLQAGVVEADDPTEGDRIVRCLVAAATGNQDMPYFPAIAPGAALGAMNHTEARTFYDLCQRFAAGGVGITVTLDGHYQAVA